jgi:hypothetical protein
MLATVAWTNNRISVCDKVAIERTQLFQFIYPVLIALFFINLGSAQSGAAYTAQRRIDTITVDGILNEASWAGAASTVVLKLWNGSPGLASLDTTAKMVWDDQHLFLGFSVKDPDVYATYTGRDVHCWEQDTLEVFVTVPGTTGYLEVDGSPTGAIWDGYFTNVFQGPGGSYNLTNLQIAGHVNGTLNNSADQDMGFTAEVRLPFSDIYQGILGGHPTNGTQLRLNLYRINWNTPAAPDGLGATGSDTYYAWSPVSGTSPAFHQPNKFGTVTFSTVSVPAPTWRFTGETLSDTNLSLRGIGHPGGTYWVLTSTNAALAVASWTRIATNTFDPVTGQFNFTNAIFPDSPQRFYRLQSP